MPALLRPLLCCVLSVSLLVFSACQTAGPGKPESCAIYAEFAQANVLMKNGPNRRVFNTTETQHGIDIRRESDGAIMLQPGRYRITGFSLVTMQTTFSPPVPQHNLNYPGYCLVYPKEFEANDPLGHQLAIGSPGTALDGTPSLFDFVYTCTTPTPICVGHQSGDQLNNEVYLDVSEAGGISSAFHLFARIAITRL